MNRTDIHRPSAPEFDPEGYTLLGVYDLEVDPMKGGQRHLFAAEVNRQVEQGRTFGGAPYGINKCSHCGTGIRYAALMLHAATRTLLCIGETCLDNRFSGTKADFDALRKNAAALRERWREQTRFEALCEEHPELAYASYATNISLAGAEHYEDASDGGRYAKRGTRFGERARCSKPLEILDDIASKARRYGQVSPKQLELVSRLLDRVAEAEGRMVVREAERAAEEAAATPAPTGRATVRGTVLKAEYRPNPYGPSGSIKAVVKTDEGWKTWMTLPKALEPGGDEAGRRLEFTATFEPSADDELFAFAKRPSKAAWLD